MKLILKVAAQSLMEWPYGNNLGSHDPTEEEVKAAYEKGEFDARVMNDAKVRESIELDALKASKNGQDKDAYCKVWKTYHARRTAYWMNEMKQRPEKWQNDEAHPVKVKLIASAGNHRTRAATILNLPTIEVEIEAEIRAAVEEA